MLWISGDGGWKGCWTGQNGAPDSGGKGRKNKTSAHKEKKKKQEKSKKKNKPPAWVGTNKKQTKRKQKGTVKKIWVNPTCGGGGWCCLTSRTKEG